MFVYADEIQQVPRGGILFKTCLALWARWRFLTRAAVPGRQNVQYQSERPQARTPALNLFRVHLMPVLVGQRVNPLVTQRAAPDARARARRRTRSPARRRGRSGRGTVRAGVT